MILKFGDNTIKEEVLSSGKLRTKTLIKELLRHEEVTLNEHKKNANINDIALKDLLINGDKKIVGACLDIDMNRIQLKLV